MQILRCEADAVDVGHQPRRLRQILARHSDEALVPRGEGHALEVGHALFRQELLHHNKGVGLILVGQDLVDLDVAGFRHVTLKSDDGVEGHVCELDGAVIVVAGVAGVELRRGVLVALRALDHGRCFF